MAEPFTVVARTVHLTWTDQRAVCGARVAHAPTCNHPPADAARCRSCFCH